MIEIARPPTDVQNLSRKLQVFAGPNRLLIFHLLMEGVQCNCELGAALGLPPNLVSGYLRALRNAGLVDSERDPVDDRWVYYSINRPALGELIQAFDLFFRPDRIKARRPTSALRAEPALKLAVSLPEG